VSGGGRGGEDAKKRKSFRIETLLFGADSSIESFDAAVQGAMQECARAGRRGSRGSRGVRARAAGDAGDASVSNPLHAGGSETETESPSPPASAASSPVTTMRKEDATLRPFASPDPRARGEAAAAPAGEAALEAEGDDDALLRGEAAFRQWRQQSVDFGSGGGPADFLFGAAGGEGGGLDEPAGEPGPPSSAAPTGPAGFARLSESEEGEGGTEGAGEARAGGVMNPLLRGLPAALRGGSAGMINMNMSMNMNMNMGLVSQERKEKLNELRRQGVSDTRAAMKEGWQQTIMAGR
jgi:hypothetical protein